MRRKKRKNLRSKKEENIIKMKKPLEDLSNTGREEKWYFFFSFIPFDASFIKIKEQKKKLTIIF